MSKNSKPTCQESGQHISIQDDSPSGICEINGKRVDLAMSPWILDSKVDTASEWKIVKKRELLIDIAHGGKPDVEPADTTLTKTVSWLVFVKESKTWDDAKIACQNMKGELFSKVNGTSEQLEFLREKMDNQKFWLGIYTEDFSVWKSMSGETIPEDKLVWQSGQPNNFGGIEDKIFIKDAPALRDIKASDQFWFICDMNV